MSGSEKLACHVCGAPGLTTIPGYQKLSRVTSDCKSWPSGGRLAVCRQCGVAQAVLDSAWHEDARIIYDSYSLYSQGMGAESSVFDAQSGEPLTRSQSLVQRLNAQALLPVRGRMLDFGCGTGGLLRSFGAAFKQWTMAGLELHEHLRPVIESIERVEHLFTCDVAKVPGSFGLITLNHVLEHIPSPGDFLAQLRHKLNDGGFILIQVPDCAQNPFMLLVADHATHFCLPSLKGLVESAGYETVAAVDDWVSKELTVVARQPAPSRTPSARGFGFMDAAALNRRMVWLNALAVQARHLSAHRPFGLFGTSVAAAFLFGEVGDAVDFFVDEDPNRWGRIWCDRPIHSPRQVPAGSQVFLGLAPVAADKVLARMNSLKLPARFYAPDPLPRAST
ncbi:MAG TPA: class I SAM-dependent methyltransferase [Candidatus Acidoferrum sp.]|nr:class I SAM-dependent methyltransferase [Candidatus Acidoferrum sp.]